MIKAVIFDLDGVLVDTEPLWYETYAKVCKEFGFEYSEELHKLTPGHADTVKLMTVKLGIPEKYPEFLERVRAVYKDLFQKIAKPVPGVVDLLKNLKGKYKLAIATSAYKPRLDYNLEKISQLKAFFDVTTHGEEVEKSKPAPDIFLITAKKLGVKPEECLVVEDSESGILAAKASGMKAVGFKPDHVFPQDLSKADLVVDDLSKISLQFFNNYPLLPT